MNRYAPAAAVLSALAVCGASTARADHYNLARVTLTPAAPGGDGRADAFQTRDGQATASASTTGGLDSFGIGAATVNYGRASLSAAAAGSLTATLTGFTRDSITISAPGVPSGTPGTLTFSVRVTGAWAAPFGQSLVRWRFVADVGAADGHDLIRAGQVESPELGGLISGDAPGTYSATIGFTYGQPLPLALEITSTAIAAPGQSGAGSASFDMPEALLWLGMKDLTANGDPITEFTALSESGTNWALPAGEGGNPCPADFNNDGFLDFFDADAFVACFEGLECPPGKSADFNDDGFVDFFDADAFLAAFEAGC